jgi:hypothetical protein
VNQIDATKMYPVSTCSTDHQCRNLLNVTKTSEIEKKLLAPTSEICKSKSTFNDSQRFSSMEPRKSFLQTLSKLFPRIGVSSSHRIYPIETESIDPGNDNNKNDMTVVNVDNSKNKSVIRDHGDSINILNQDSKAQQPQQLEVLVIEDTLLIQKMLTRWFTQHGCHVTCADNGLIGLQCMKTKQFDLVICDFLMVSG